VCEIISLVLPKIKIIIMNKNYVLKLTVILTFFFGITNLWSQVTTFSYTGVIDLYTVPAGVTSLQIEATGAQGGIGSAAAGGFGATMQGDFIVTPGQIIEILVGEQPQAGNGGGGGSFAIDQSTGNPLVIAGAGGGGAGACCGTVHNGVDAVITLDGTDGLNASGGSGTGGVNGNGGAAGVNGQQSGCGGGFLTSGADGQGGSTGGQSYLLGGASGTYDAGFGGGGGSHGVGDVYAGGGGGGYSGGGSTGGGGQWGGGGGGGSINNGTNQVNAAGLGAGSGQVVITVLCNASANAFSVDVCDAYTVPSGDTTYMVSGVYNDTILNATGCDSVMTITVDVATLDLNTTTTDFTITADQATGSYQWINCSDNSPIAGETNQSFTADANGDYAVILSDGPCSDTSACATIAGVGIDEVNASNVSIYPNPTNGEFYVSTIANAVSVTVYSVDGKVIINNLKVNDSNESINLGNVENGVYFVEVTSDSNKETIRLIVK
jgi:hypothetical protein